MLDNPTPQATKRVVVLLVVIGIFDTAVCIVVRRSGQLDRDFFSPFCLILFGVTLLPFTNLFLTRQQGKIFAIPKALPFVKFLSSRFFFWVLIPVMAGVSIGVLAPHRPTQLVAFCFIILVGGLLHWSARALQENRGRAKEGK